MAPSTPNLRARFTATRSDMLLPVIGNLGLFATAIGLFVTTVSFRRPARQAAH